MTLCALTATAPCVLLPLAPSSLSRTLPYSPDLLPELAPLLICPFQSTLSVALACMHTATHLLFLFLISASFSKPEIDLHGVAYIL